MTNSSGEHGHDGGVCLNGMRRTDSWRLSLGTRSYATWRSNSRGSANPHCVRGAWV